MRTTLLDPHEVCRSNGFTLAFVSLSIRTYFGINNHKKGQFTIGRKIFVLLEQYNDSNLLILWKLFFRTKTYENSSKFEEKNWKKWIFVEILWEKSLPMLSKFSWPLTYYLTLQIRLFSLTINNCFAWKFVRSIFSYPKMYPKNQFSSTCLLS